MQNQNVMYNRVKTLEKVSLSSQFTVNLGFVINRLSWIGRIMVFSIILTGVKSVSAAKVVIPLYHTDDVVIADYDVSDFGADFTGVNDATAAIQRAIDACYNSGGGTVWIPAGAYKVTNTIFVKSFVTLRGDWRDPDTLGSGYGTVINALVQSGDYGSVLFQIGGSAAAMGLTIYYPLQDPLNPVSYNFTFNLGNWAGQAGTYMANNVINCTMLNSYRGIGKGALDHTEVHECGTIRNVKGTVLYNGVVAFNSADVDTWSHINFSNSYWANAGVAYHAPLLSVLNNWTRANGIAYTFGDLEWDQFYDLKCSDYKIGINIVAGSRISFCGSFVRATIINTTIALKTEVLDERWGTSFLRSTLSGSDASVSNSSGGYVKLTDCVLTGSTTGSVQKYAPGTSPDSYQECVSVPKVTRTDFFDVTKAPFNAPFSLPQTVIPSSDATSAIQLALNTAGDQGGGVVYLPAGWYKISSHLTVPANVELRGSSSTPQLDQSDLSLGTTLLGYEGINTAYPDSDPALVTLNGDNSGISGIRFFYPNNNPANGVKQFPYAIRGNGSNLYLTNIGLTGVYNAVDFSTYRCDNHFLRNVSGAIYNNGLVMGASSHGWIESCLTNPAKADRCNYGVAGWITENNIFTQLIDPVTKVLEKHIVINGASDEQLLNCFSYGSDIELFVKSGTVNGFNIGTDNVGEYAVRVDCGSNNVNVMNLMRYNGTTSTGTVKVYNEMHLSNDLSPRTSAPVITSRPSLMVKTGTTYTYTIVATGVPEPALHVMGNPSWMTLNGSTLSGIPPNTGTVDPITITAINSACPAASQTFSIESLTAAINYVLESQISIYPNPSSGLFNVSIGNNKVNKVDVLNMLGEKVFATSLLNPQSSNTLDLSSQQNGIYFMKVYSSEGNAIKKLIIAR